MTRAETRFATFNHLLTSEIKEEVEEVLERWNEQEKEKGTERDYYSQDDTQTHIIAMIL